MLAVAATAFLAGCGGNEPHLARTDAAPLITLADRIAREGPCAQARDIRTLHARFRSLVNRKRVPGELQEPLGSGMNALAAQTPPCVPRVQPAETTPTVTRTTPATTPRAPAHHKPKKHDKPKHGHKKK